MTPKDFEYFVPSSVNEAVSLLSKYGDEAKALAGGQSLLLLMKLRLAEPKYLSSNPIERESSGKYSANCVLMGNISEKKDTQGNIIFSGQIKNIGGRRADFVKVDFVFRKNWSGETKTLTTFLVGTYHTFDSGITTDATLLPGSVGTFELYVPHSFGTFIGYSYVIDWEEYQ